MVEQRAVAVRRRGQLLQERREERRVVGVDLRQLGQRLRHVAVVRERVVRVGHPDLAVGAAAQLVPRHERADAGAVRLPGQKLQVVHQPGVLGQRRRDAARALQQRQLPVALRLGDLDAPFDVAHRVEVRPHLAPVARAELALQPRDVLAHRVEDAPLRRPARLPRRRIGAVVVAEQALEDGARVVLHRQRRRPAGPRDGVGERATEAAAVARPGEVGALEPELERRQRRPLPQLPRRELVDRDRVRVPGARMLGGQELGGGARVRTAGDPRRRRAGETGQHQQAVAVRGERLEDGGHLEPRAGRRRRPAPHDHAVRDVDRAEADRRLRGRLPQCAQRRHHAVEKRQGERGADSAQHRPAGNRLLRDHHDSALLIWNGMLRTMPRMMDDQR